MDASLPESQAPSSLVSFVTLFGRRIGDLTIHEIEIPQIQRDYAQGRHTQTVRRIRENFIRSLRDALLPQGAPIDLDFIFGDVEGEGKFAPLDGQQRLTTLFLLHCYLAWRNNVDGTRKPYFRFSYATRPGARDFCAFLVTCKPDFVGRVSEWIKDHSDYLPTWRHDPTVQSMLTVLDTIDDLFGEGSAPDFALAWQKLTDETDLAIRFHILPVKANGLTDSLYIKMNSRGKPLTDFENFKAHFEALLKAAGHEKAETFTQNVDTVWSDILWPYRGDDSLIDDEFLRYFRFVTEINAWRSNVDFNDDTRHDDLAERVYSAQAPRAAENVEFLFHAFDTWVNTDIRTEFSKLFKRVADSEGDNEGALLLFNAFEKEGVDLFHACCRSYDTPSWTLAHTLLLYGVLAHRIVEREDRSNRLRLIRNLVEASRDEIRTGERNSMPRLLDEIDAIVRGADLSRVVTFNQAQVGNEVAKAAMLCAAPHLETDLHAVEDHDLIRGGLVAFDLDPGRFGTRARTFVSLFDKTAQGWKALTGALLTKGDYSRHDLRHSQHRMADFGAPVNDEPWRELLRGKKGERVHPTLQPLMALLDDVAENKLTPSDMAQAYVKVPGTQKDWRYYFVKYAEMRNGASGRYTISSGGGYQVCMLNKARLSSNYRDPYLCAIVAQSGMDRSRIANAGWPNSFSGFETEPRTLILANSMLKIECVKSGWEISGDSKNLAHQSAWDAICKSRGIATGSSPRLLVIAQTNGIDDEDRVEKGADLLRAMVEAGL
ncbi:DUF262 domain-containing protein [Paraburkholderia strydomiana]|uniref:DUF262 domain-containing protein n=1 Tax=Paraburkholderia strydomiana TaxID=1245417 RepID=UPI0038B9784F